MPQHHGPEPSHPPGQGTRQIRRLPHRLRRHQPREIGNPPHYGTVNKLRQEGIPLVPHRARQMTKQDYRDFDYLIGMDDANVRNMERIAGGDPDHKIYKLLEFAGSGRAIADPWYTGNFEVTYEDVLEGCEAFLESLPM